MPDLIGQSLGRYHILDQLGEGGMATVYKAYDTRLERDVAIKIIRRGAFPPDQLERILKRFEREAKSLAKLSHPNIVKVLDFGEHEDAPYLVMEYFPGGTLKPRLGKPIPWQDAVRLLLPISQALEYAHEHNIIHRDIKPANILLTEKGQPMLTDFGIAKIMETDETATLTGTGVGVGTPEYMAPEQWTGQTTPQSDIYSLGVVFYEMITGRKPYTADTPAAILLKQATDPLPRPTQFIPDLPDSIEKTLIKAMAKKVEDRYQTITEFVHALEILLSGVAPSVIPQPAASKPQAARPREKTRDTMATVNQPDTQATIHQDEEATVDDTPVVGVQKPATKTVKQPAPSGILHYWPLTVGAVLIVCIVLVALILPVIQSLGGANAQDLVQGTPTSEVPLATPTAVITTNNLVEDAKNEGLLSTIALPHDWANYGEIIETFKSKYGLEINELNPDAGSGDELEAIRSNKDSMGLQSPDVVDIGLAWGQTAQQEGLLAPYKVTSWSTIPLKHEDGYWWAEYYGVLSFEFDKDAVFAPKDWSDLLRPEYKDKVFMSGDVLRSNQAVMTVLSSGISRAGLSEVKSDEDAIMAAQAGLEYWKEMYQLGNFIPIIANQSRIASGETPLTIEWTYLSLANRDALAGDVNLEIVIPKTGVLAGPYVGGISAYAPHPNAAKLWWEFVMSDEGQLLFLKGYAYPIRYNDMVARSIIPAELAAKLPPPESVARAIFLSPEQLTLAKDYITQNWLSVVGVEFR